MEKDRRVGVRSSSRPEERGKEQYIELDDEPVVVISSSRDYRDEDDSDLDAQLERQLQRKLQEKQAKQAEQAKQAKQESFDNLAPKQPQKKSSLMGGFFDLLKTNFKSSSSQTKAPVREDVQQPVPMNNMTARDTAHVDFRPNIVASGGQVYLGPEHQNANTVLPNGVDKLIVNGCTRLNGLYVNSNARVPVKASTNRLVVNHLILGEKATEFLQMNNTMMLYPLKVTSQVPMKLTGRQVWDLLCFVSVFNSEIIQNEARYFVGDGVDKKPWEYPYITDRRELKEVFAAEFILNHNTDKASVLNAIKQRYQITFDTAYCGREFRKYWDTQLTEKSIRKDLGFVDDRDKHSYHSTSYKYFMDVITELVSHYNLWGI